MKKNPVFYLLSSILSLTSSLSFAMPSHPEAVSGTAEVRQVDQYTMEIHPSDQSILQYRDFQVGSQEKVRFVQSSSASCVLNRITGENPSQILGSLESNGKVFLVNPSGIYFGPESQVNVGSLIASTLDIANEDFLQGKYRFSLSQGSNGSLVNEGFLSSLEGSIVLLAPQISNLGSIQAKAGSVILAGGEHVTLDFTGDGLIQFSVEGNLKEAVIEHLGDIQGSIVSMKLPVAKKAIHEIVNTEGLEEAYAFIEEDGVIKFASSSQLQASKVQVEAPQLFVQGSMDASSSIGEGGAIHLFGAKIALEGASLDVSGLLGGGEVLLGGEFQGKGTTPYASKVLMDEHSDIYANATGEGDGGLVVLWSQDRTLFEGNIYAQGGSLGGKGGLVETSSQGSLEINGNVNTLDAMGNAGEWLLDPYFLYILSPGSYFSPCGYYDCPTTVCYGNCDESGHNCTTNCITTPTGCWSDCSTVAGSCNLSSSVLLNLTTNITLQAYLGISIKGNVDVTGANGFTPTITFHCCNVMETSGLASYLSLGDYYGHYTVNGNGAKFVLDNINETQLYNTFNFNTGGSDLNLGKMVLGSSNSGHDVLTINTGGGSFTFTAPDHYTDNGSTVSQTLINGITVVNASSITTGDVYVTDNFNANGIPVFINANGSVNVSARNGSLNLGAVNAAEGTAPALTLSASQISLGNVGDINSLQSFNVSTNAATLSNVNVTGDINFNFPLSLSGSLTSQSGSISLGSTLTLIGNSSFSASTDISVDSSISTSGNSYDLNLTALGSIKLSGAVTNLTDLTMSGNSITLNNNVTVLGSLELTSEGVISAGGNINALSFTIPSATQFNFSNNIVTSTGAINVSCPAIFSGGSGATISSAGGSITFAGSLTTTVTKQPLAINTNSSATISMNSIGSIATPFTNINLITSGTTNLAGSVYASGYVHINNGTLNITGNTLIQGDGISIGSITPGSTDPSLTLNAGNNPLSVVFAYPASYFGDVSITASSLQFTSGLYSDGHVTINAPVTISDITSIYGHTGVTLNNPITATTPGVRLDLNGDTGDLTVSGLGTASIPLGILNLYAGTSLITKGSIYTSSPISFANPVTIGATATLEGSSITLGSISSSPVNNSLTLTSSGDITVTSLSNLKDLSINNAIALTLPSLDISGNFIQTGAGNVSLSTSMNAGGSISFSGPLTVAGDASLQAAGGISINGAITPSSAPNLTLNAGTNALQATFASTAINPFGSLSVTAGSLTLGGGLYSTNSIGINAPITISSDATFDSSAEGITLSGAVNGNNSNPALTLSAPGAISLQSLGSTNSLGDVSISGSGVALAGSIGSVGSIDITGPVTISSALILSGTSVTLNSDLGAASSTDYNFNIYGSSITVQNLGTNISSMGNIILSSSGPISCGNLYSLHSITLTGTDIILGTTLVAPETTNINNTGSLTISGTTISTGMFSQKGTGNVSLSASIATGGSISFSGPLTVSGTVSLEGLGGITISGGITPSSAPNLTLNAGANGLQATFTSTALNPFGSLSFTAGSLILGGDLYSTASILIDTPVTISADTTFASSAGNITLSGSLSGNSSNLNLNLTALGTISLQSLGSGIVPLRNVTISGDLVDLAGNIISVGLLEITGPVTISSSLTLQGNAGVTLNSNLVPDSLNLDLTVASYTTGSISVQNLGTISASLGGITLSNIASTEVAGPISCGNLYSSGNIAIRGTTIGLGSTLSAVGSISIDNEELLTISSGTSITAASFSQKGPGNVSLSAEINTTGLISFSGPLTVSGTVSLEGAGGIIASGGITPSSAPNLILNAGANALQATFNSTESNPFGSLSITAGSFTLGGGLYSTNAIEINAPITISSNATISSSAGGITLSEAVNGSSSTQYFDLSLIAQSGTISLQSLGRTGPLGNVTISGGLVDLAANIISIGLLEITGPITISPSLTLQGNAGVTLNSNLIPDGLNSDLTVASYTTGSISVQNLGTISAPLGSITLSNIASTEVAGPISCGNLYSSGNIDLSGTTIGLGSTLSAEGIISINNTALLTISSGISIAAAGFSQTGLGAVSLNENIDISGAISFTGPITIESSVALIGSSIALGTVSANSSLNFSLTSTSGAITASSLGIDGFPLNDVTIHNVGSLTVPLLYLTGNFSQTGSGAVSLNSDIDIPGTISFEGPITIGSRVSLQGSTIDLASLSASATGLDLNLTSTSGAVSVISLGESGTALQNVTIHNATVLTMPSLNIEGSFSQTGAPVSLLANVYAGGSISFEGALTVAGNAILNGKEGITISSITASGTPNLTLNAGLYPLSATFVSSEVQPFGPLSVTASNFILAGDLYSNGLIAIAAPMTISADTTIFSTTSGITLSSALGSENSGAALNLRAASLISVQSLGNTSIPLGDVTIIGTGVTLGGDVVSEGSIAITGPITSSTSLLSLTGNFGITLDNDLTSSTSSNVHFEAIEGPITVQNLGTSGSKLGDIEIVGFRSVSSGNLFSSKSISLMGTDITFGSSFIASQDVNISNTGPINMAFAPLTLSGNFTQSGVGAVSLGATINAAGTISFAGETLTISSATTLKGTKGISIVSSLAPSSGTHPNFTLNAGSNPLSAVFGSTASNPFGALSVTASNFTLGGNLYSNTSIAIYAPMTISANTEINSLNGYQGIYLSKAVSATIPFLSLTVSGSQGPVDVGALGTVDVPLGGISLSGTEITLRGNILSTGTVVLNGDSTIENNLTLQGDQGITLQNILLPSTDAFTLALKASGGSILTQNLGSPAQYMGNISLLGTNFNVGSTTVSSGSSVTFSNNSGSVHIDGPCSVNPPCTYPAYSYP